MPLFSDGLSNFGERPFPALRVPVYSVSAAAWADNARRRAIGEGSGGVFIDLTRETAASAAAALPTTTSRVVALESNGATQLVAASPRRPTPPMAA